MGSYSIFRVEKRVGPDEAPAWGSARRELYLLRVEVDVPCSVDQMVWPHGSGPNARTIALGLFVPGPDDEAAEFLRSLGEPVRAPDPAWTRLGYDVADSGFTSGLSNCGYRSDMDDVEGLRRQWSSRINDRGLLATHEDALAFRALSDERIPEHAPFFVFGLWDVGDQVAGEISAS